MKLADIKKRIEANVKGVHVSVLADSNIAAERDWIQSPCYDLNRIISGSFFRGIPNKIIVGIVGPEASMKSSFMVLCMVEAQKKGYTPVIIDTEGGINNTFCERWGLDIESCMYIYTPFVEEVIAILGQLEGSGDKYIIGIDSIGNLQRQKALKDAKKGKYKQDQGLLQKDLKAMFRLFLALCIKQNSIGIACGHLYGRPGLVPMPDQIGGGKAMRYLPRILINLKKEYITEGGDADEEGTSKKQIIGTRLKAYTLKNNLYPPFQEAIVDIDYRKGIDPYAGIIEQALGSGIIVASGSWYDVGEEKKIQGREALKQYLFEDESILEKLEEWIADTGYSTINEEIEEAAKLVEDGEEE